MKTVKSKTLILCLIFFSTLFSFPIAAQNNNTQSKVSDETKSIKPNAILVLQPKSENLSPEELLWVPGNINESIKKNVQSKLKIQLVQDKSETAYEIQATVKKTGTNYSIKIELLKPQSGQVVLSEISAEYSNPASLYIKSGAIDLIFEKFASQISVSNKNYSSKNPNGLMLHNNLRKIDDAFSVGTGVLFSYEISTYNQISYLSHTTDVVFDLSYNLFPTAKSEFGFAANLDAALPFILQTWRNDTKTSISLLNTTCMGYFLDGSLGCQYRHSIDKKNGIEFFLGASVSFYYMEYTNHKTSTESEQKSIMNMIFGIQTRGQYTYSFNDFVSIQAGLIFDYDFYSLAQIKYPEDYDNFANFFVTPLVSAKFNF